VVTPINSYLAGFGVLACVSWWLRFDCMFVGELRRTCSGAAPRRRAVPGAEVIRPGRCGASQAVDTQRRQVGGTTRARYLAGN
jgi:hypothetical protein